MKKYSTPVLILGVLNVVLVLMFMLQSLAPARYNVVPDGNRFWWVDQKNGKLIVCSAPNFIDYAPSQSQPMKNVYCIKDFWRSYEEEASKR